MHHLTPSMSKPMKLTPMLEQYFEIKRQVPDAIVFYRLGDFYEMFFEDAEKAAPILDLVLTARGKGGESETPMCGVPYHAAEGYIAKLIRHGFRVALCDQVEDPAAAKGIVRREVVRIITPGTSADTSIVEGDSCYLVALVPGAELTGAAFLDVSTGDFFVTCYGGLHDERLADDLARFRPREAVFPREAANGFAGELAASGMATTPLEDSLFEVDGAADYLTRHFGTQSLRGFGLDSGDLRVAAAGGALRYASSSHKRQLDHVRSLRVDNGSEYLQLDAATLENLEILDSRDPGRPRASLWSVMNATCSAMGTRTLRRWLIRPLRTRDAIFARHDAVAELTRTRQVLESMTNDLGRIADLERLASRITLRLAGPRECLALADSLKVVGGLKKGMAALAGPLLAGLRDTLDPLAEVEARILSTIDRDAPALLKEGGVVRSGIDPELDSLRAIAHDSKSILLKIEIDERERTGISSLKVRFNSVFGYYIEVSKANLARVPVDYIRKQTLVNAERFITPELKTLEEKIVGAEEKSIAIENRIYEELLALVAQSSAAILKTAAIVGETDALSSLATTALRRRYVRPTLSDQAEICIQQGRHPVIESIADQRFIPNDSDIVRDRNGIQIITGPNMGGKSTYLRQVALIVLLNQAGSFVPASGARLGIFDRIFTRVGASDQLARGESTFMVEMHETANILNNATDRSLIILDEVGRGTATFDGLSLAWAIIEFLHDNATRGGITLFATHYHEVTDLAKTRPRVANYSVAVKEWNDQIIFLRKVVPGAADKSYGIQVAKLAGIPQSVIERARMILATLERKEVDLVAETQKTSGRATAQLSLFDSREREVVADLRSLQLDRMSPMEALNELNRLKKRLD
jgi:DNA mismatch repair protein MutS